MTDELLGTEEAPQATETGGPDIAAQLAALNQRFDERFDALEGRIPQPEPQDLRNLGYQHDEISPEDQAYLEAMYGGGEEQIEEEYGEEGETEQVDPALYENMSEMNDRLAAIEDERIDREFTALSERYPDITSEPIVEKLRVEMNELAARYGDQVFNDARAVEMAYKAVKADAVAAAEQPAEPAASGAHLESGAGSTQQGESDPSKEYKDALLRGSESSIFG